jgi:hypothetical protein
LISGKQAIINQFAGSAEAALAITGMMYYGEVEILLTVE